MVFFLRLNPAGTLVRSFAQFFQSKFLCYRLSEKLFLFQDLKAIVEKILSHHSLDVWSVYGGLQSLVQSLDAIFHHGIKPQTVSLINYKQDKGGVNM